MPIGSCTRWLHDSVQPLSMRTTKQASHQDLESIMMYCKYKIIVCKQRMGIPRHLRPFMPDQRARRSDKVVLAHEVSGHVSTKETSKLRFTARVAYYEESSSECVRARCYACTCCTVEPPVAQQQRGTRYVAAVDRRP